ncbi:hypothetical protein UFOVP746_7 [uncultured Caudovirales phage]|jgi:vacuolar-type H+-ATPase catalytic subunit A/Vma1|uniref:Uncharacterized protein n=1 Tax=uncultured Caudovirales phage TaxID=2100421 RepID=A0A6J7X4A7_9CAUD|nr:hypothetical protein UFOVP746_7 [uncultured Caudovirales phage]
MKLSSVLKVDHDNLRIRSFVMNGQPFKVRVPLAAEMEAINKRVAEVEYEEKYQEIYKPFIGREETLEGEKIRFEKDDVFINDKSLRELAKISVQTEQRIVEMVRLLVPVQKDFDMSQITYKEIDAEFPFSIQMDLMKKIIEVVSPNYEETRKN